MALEDPEACSRLHVGDLVRYVGPGISALDGGPGEVTRLGRGIAWVRLRFNHGFPNGDQADKGEVLIFAVERLEVVH